jgi:hypothetical protein
MPEPHFFCPIHKAYEGGAGNLLERLDDILDISARFHVFPRFPHTTIP